ncbi:MAG: S1 RNA-binding domain-containing protein, partial [candidate division KSB1 bacterium]|nr:S1 RNA-binding domain-containing protein [candidate division KSB1 bacterium]
MDQTINPNPTSNEEQNLASNLEGGLTAAPETADRSTAADFQDPIASQIKSQQVPSTGDPASLDIAKLDEMEKEYTEQEFEAMAKFYEDTLIDFKAGQVVVGRVLAIGEKEVSIDIGFKSEGTVPVEEFDNLSELKIGDSVEVLIDEIEDKEGFLVLSKRKADFMRTWDRVIESYERGEILRGQCIRRIKGGFVVDLGGVDAFLPGSQVDVRPVRDFDSLIGRTMDFKIVKVNHLRKNIVVSHRVLVEEEMKEQREKILAELQRGQVLEGIVKNITDFGVFIDLGGVDGLLH